MEKQNQQINGYVEIADGAYELIQTISCSKSVWIKPFWALQKNFLFESRQSGLDISSSTVE